MINKAKLQEQIKSMPEEFSIDELVERLIFVEKVEIGIKQSETEDVLSEVELEAEMKRWFK